MTEMSYVVGLLKLQQSYSLEYTVLILYTLISFIDLCMEAVLDVTKELIEIRTMEKVCFDCISAI